MLATTARQDRLIEHQRDSDHSAKDHSPTIAVAIMSNTLSSPLNLAATRSLPCSHLICSSISNSKSSPSTPSATQSRYLTKAAMTVSHSTEPNTPTCNSGHPWFIMATISISMASISTVMAIISIIMATTSIIMATISIIKVRLRTSRSSSVDRGITVGFTKARMRQQMRPKSQA